MHMNEQITTKPEFNALVGQKSIVVFLISSFLYNAYIVYACHTNLLRNQTTQIDFARALFEIVTCALAGKILFSHF